MNTQAHEYDFDPTADMRGYRALGAAVLVRGIKDANTPDERLRSGGNSGCVSPLEKQVAHRWIVDSGPDFRFWCAVAGMDPDAVREAYLAGGDVPVYRRETGDGPRLRQAQVLEMHKRGLSITKIAAALGLCRKTVSADLRAATQ